MVLYEQMVKAEQPRTLYSKSLDLSRGSKAKLFSSERARLSLLARILRSFIYVIFSAILTCFFHDFWMICAIKKNFTY